MMQISSMPALVEFEQVIMKQRAGDAVWADDGKQFLLHRVRRREMPRAESGDGDDGFADHLAEIFSIRHSTLNVRVREAKHAERLDVRR